MQPLGTTKTDFRRVRVLSSTGRPQANNPLHGVTLEHIVTELVDYFGWAEMGKEIKINCFKSDPSVSSSLKFLRRTPWARTQVEELYIYMLRLKAAETNE